MIYNVVHKHLFLFIWPSCPKACLSLVWTINIQHLHGSEVSLVVPHVVFLV
jgi:hypothetical protein